MQGASYIYIYIIGLKEMVTFVFNILSQGNHMSLPTFLPLPFLKFQISQLALFSSIVLLFALSQPT